MWKQHGRKYPFSSQVCELHEKSFHFIHKFGNWEEISTIKFTTLGTKWEILSSCLQVWEIHEEVFPFVHKFGKYTKISQPFPVQ